MNLECLNDIITTNLAIEIDLSDLKSWNLNTGMTSISLTKWSGATVDNISLMDFGLTAFDNGRTNIMWSGLTLNNNDNLFTMYNVGYNTINNPTPDETSGITTTTQYLPISAITSGTTGNYFELNGGYLQGFFKLEGYNYELLPARYGHGITIETLISINPDSHGIFYMMGARAEDKYNSYFSGETITGETTIGVVTSDDNYLDAFESYETLRKGFKSPENMVETKHRETNPINNIKNNIIAFELTEDKKIAYRYVDGDGMVKTNSSLLPINPTTGWTMITIVYTPNTILTVEQLKCGKQRTGKLSVYVNGRANWIVNDFPEFYFKGFENDREKQIGVPYSISWGGGSFGLGESYHYDYQTYHIYNENDQSYINSEFQVQPNPIPSNCYSPPTGNTYQAGLALSADTSTFTYFDECDPNTELPLTVMRIKYTGTTGTSANTYFIKFMQPVSVLSNRDYIIDYSLYVDGIFDVNGQNKITTLIYSDDIDVHIIEDIEYIYPFTSAYIEQQHMLGLHPFPDDQEYQWVVDGIMYYGITGLPVTRENSLIVGYSNQKNNNINYVATAQDTWLSMKSKFRTPNNTGQSFVNIGLLIESDVELISGGTFYIKDFTYTASDILVKDDRKSNLTIEQNFDSSFNGGIQKLRVYDKALTSQEVLHNTLIEVKNNPSTNILISKGGRIIYK